MTDERPNEQPAEPAADNRETKLLSTEESRQFAAFRYRKLFAEAQEQFAAGEFVAANRSLKEIPEDDRGADAQRLQQLVTERIREVAELRSAVQAALNQRQHDALQPKLLRLLELQPGDEWANTIRHRLEEDEHARTAAATPAISELVSTRPTEVPREPARPRPREAAPARPQRPPPTKAAATAIEIVDDEGEDADEAWEFGERLVQSSPRKRRTGRPQSARPTAAMEDDDLTDWLEPEASSSPAMWIAIAVSGVVILLALVATIVVLLVER